MPMQLIQAIQASLRDHGPDVSEEFDHFIGSPVQPAALAFSPLPQEQVWPSRARIVNNATTASPAPALPPRNGELCPICPCSQTPNIRRCTLPTVRQTAHEQTSALWLHLSFAESSRHWSGQAEGSPSGQSLSDAAFWEEVALGPEQTPTRSAPSDNEVCRSGEGGATSSSQENEDGQAVAKLEPSWHSSMVRSKEQQGVWQGQYSGSCAAKVMRCVPRLLSGNFNTALQGGGHTEAAPDNRPAAGLTNEAGKMPNPIFARRYQSRCAAHIILQLCQYAPILSLACLSAISELADMRVCYSLKGGCASGKHGQQSRQSDLRRHTGSNLSPVSADARTPPR